MKSLNAEKTFKEKSGKYVKKLRSITGLKQQPFAKKLNLTASYISQLEKNYVDISLSTFLKYCDIWEVNYSEIFEDKF